MAETINRETVLAALGNVIEPDIKKDIVTLNLVSELKLNDNKISFSVQVQNPTMKSRKLMEDACYFQLERAFGKDVEVEISTNAINTEERPDLRKVIPGVKNIIAISSGKGGVGKSTVASNMAVALAKVGYTVGYVDADVYGPSAPTMFDLVHEKPGIVEVNGKKMIQPLESYGVKVLSLGFFAEANQAIVWRGAMASKALKQMFRDANWGELDVMIIDLPPGTGDIHLSLVQTIPVNGAVVVSTPQEVALADARKGIDMFKLDSINVPVLGIIENMAYFTPAELPDNKYYIFGKEGAQQLAETMDVPFLGEIPLVQSIREAGDIGRPAVLQEDTPVAKAFQLIAHNTMESLEKRNEELEATKVVKITTR